MSELYEGLVDSLGQFIRSWLAPAAIAVGLARALILPSVDGQGVARELTHAAPEEQALVCAFAAFLAAVVLAASKSGVYRVLEGYSLPNTVKDAWRDIHLTQFDELRSGRRTGGKKRLALIEMYPRRRSDIMPTRLGNVLKAGETYGTDQYGLDLLVLWTRLVAVASNVVRDQLNASRAVVDFFVGVVALAPLWAFGCVFAAFWGDEPLLVLAGALGLWVARLAYLRAVSASTWYRNAMRAMVDMTRRDLAKALDLELPLALADERELWFAVSQFIGWGRHWSESQNWISVIEKHRISTNS